MSLGLINGIGVMKYRRVSLSYAVLTSRIKGETAVHGCFVVLSAYVGSAATK